MGETGHAGYVNARPLPTAANVISASIEFISSDHNYLDIKNNKFYWVKPTKYLQRLHPEQNLHSRCCACREEGDMPTLSVIQVESNSIREITKSTTG